MDHQGKTADKTLRDAQEREDLFRLVVKHSADAIVVVDRRGIMRFLNLSAERLFGRPAEQMVGQVFGFPIYNGEPQELDIVRPGKDSRVAEMRVVETELHGETLYVASLRDTTELVRLREKLRAMSLLDELTGLYNRRGFLTLAQQQLKVADRTRRGMFLVFADLDNMKWINDTIGHHEGDMALIETANILKETFRESDIIARIGGDEFAIVAIEVPTARAEILTARLLKNLETRNAEVNRRFRLSLSIGIARFGPESPCPIDELLARADRLMYKQKQGKPSLSSRGFAAEKGIQYTPQSQEAHHENPWSLFSTEGQ